jgi:hypothetical protein
MRTSFGTPCEKGKPRCPVMQGNRYVTYAPAEPGGHSRERLGSVEADPGFRAGRIG